MADEQYNKSDSNIISTEDLGDGKKQVTFSVDASKLTEYFDILSGMDGVSFDGGNKVAKGSVMSRYDELKNAFNNKTSNDTPYTQALKTPTDPHKKIKLAVELYTKEPIIGTTIDLMVDFSASGFTNDCDDDEIKKLYDKWGKEINLNSLIEGIFLEYYRSGNVTIYRSEENAKVKKISKSKTKTESKEYLFPAGYTILNPMNVIVEGSLLFDQEIIRLRLNSELVDFIKSNKKNKSTLVMIPDDFVKAVRSGNDSVILNPELTRRITRKKQPYERYASPFLERVFEPVLYKQKLRMMDMSTIEGLVNQLVTVTVGDKDFPASDDDLKAIASLFQTPSKAYTVFWNHTLQVKFHKPEGLDTLTADKYKQVNDDILAGLGVSRVLLDGQGANFSTAWVSILSLIERLENARAKIQEWLEEEYKRIADENGFSVHPKVRFNRMNLREDTYIRDVLLAMYDRGLIDEEDLLLETGRDYNNVIEMKKRNEKNKKLFFPPEQPFQGGQTGTNSGRPTGSGGNYKKRTTSPEQNSGKAPKAKTSKATASLQDIQEEYEHELASYYDYIMDEIQLVIEENQDKDNTLLQIIVASTIMSLFRTFLKEGEKVISETFDREFANYTDGFYSKNNVKAELHEWNSSYIYKLSNDIKDGINERIASGQSIDEAVTSTFDSNRYRVSMIAKAGVGESVRQAKIHGNIAIGNTVATWRSALADNTCETCRGLHGRQFRINDVPPRPHANCQCELDFS